MIALAAPITNSTASNLIVGHVNHGTRGAESDEDSKFVKQLAEESGLEYYESVCHDSQPLGSSEESLRNFRYEQLLELATRLGAIKSASARGGKRWRMQNRPKARVAPIRAP